MFSSHVDILFLFFFIDNRIDKNRAPMILNQKKFRDPSAIIPAHARLVQQQPGSLEALALVLARSWQLQWHAAGSCWMRPAWVSGRYVWIKKKNWKGKLAKQKLG